MSYMDLSKKVEEALAAAAVDAGLGDVAILTGTDDATKTTPCVVCACESIGPEDPLYSGNYWASARVTVASKASDSSLATHRSRVSSVFDEMRRDDVATVLSAHVSDFHCFGVTCGGMATDNTESSFTDSITLNLYCCASDIS